MKKLILIALLALSANGFAQEETGLSTTFNFQCAERSLIGTEFDLTLDEAIIQGDVADLLSVGDTLIFRAVNGAEYAPTISRVFSTVASGVVYTRIVFTSELNIPNGIVVFATLVAVVP